MLAPRGMMLPLKGKEEDDDSCRINLNYLKIKVIYTQIYAAKKLYDAVVFIFVSENANVPEHLFDRETLDVTSEHVFNSDANAGMLSVPASSWNRSPARPISPAIVFAGIT